MSYEAFRADLISRVSDSLPSDQLGMVLAALDGMSSSWDFQTKQMAIITSGGLPDAVKLYLASKSVENRTIGTLKNYFSTLRDFFAVVCKNVNDVTSADVRLWLNWFKAERKISSAYLDHKRVVLNSFFSWLVDEDIIHKNPMVHIHPIKCEDPLRIPMTAVELETVRKSCLDLREKALVDFLYSSAARASEVCDLKVSDVNFVDNTVHIRCGKGGKGRMTFLNAESAVSLRAYLESRTDNNQCLFAISRAPFSGIQKKSLEDAIMRIVSRCELSVHVTPHIFRHTAASLALQRGMPIDQVQKWLGHARIQTTLRYARLLNVDVKISHQKYVS